MAFNNALDLAKAVVGKKKIALEVARNNSSSVVFLDENSIIKCANEGPYDIFFSRFQICMDSYIYLADFKVNKFHEDPITINIFIWHSKL